MKVAGDLNGQVAGVLGGAGWTTTADGDGALIVDVGDTESHEITRRLAGAGMYVSELTPVSRSLEDVFLELTETAETP